MVLYSVELLERNGLDFLTRSLLGAISNLDNLGAWTWNLYYVALVTAVILGFIRLVVKEKRGIDWYEFIHAIVTASGSLACIYLDVVATERLTGIPEPLRSLQCHGPLTSLHRVLPAITMGYGIVDLLDGLMTPAVDSVLWTLHGTITLSVMAFAVKIEATHLMTPMLLMEASTIFLAVDKADFFPDNIVMVNQACFVISFILCRIVVVPFLWANIMLEVWRNKSDPVFQDCFPAYGQYAAFLFGLAYHLLNGYWFTKIVKKARRRILGIKRKDLSSAADRLKKE